MNKLRSLFASALLFLGVSAVTVMAQTTTPTEEMTTAVTDAVGIWDIVYPIIISVVVFGILRKLAKKAG